MTAMKIPTFRSDVEEDQVKIYSYIIVQNIESILSHFDIKYYKIGRRYSFACPVHGSNNGDSACIYNNNFTWQCFTNGCHHEIGKPAFFMVQKLLDTRVYSDVIQFVDGIADKTIVSVEPEWKPERKLTEGKIDRGEVRRRLLIPAPFFINRGFSEEVLDRYDVGDCKNNQSDMKYRVVVPIYDDDYEKMVGCVGRTKNPQCSKCNKYHYGPKCPTNAIEMKWAAKWTVSRDFRIENYFYNLWFAKDAVRACNSVILVEGQSDVWRVVEAGFYNVLGLFGARLTPAQSIILEQLGPKKVFICTDNDKTGISVATGIKKRLSGYFNSEILMPNKTKDFGDSSIADIQQIFKGKI